MKPIETELRFEKTKYASNTIISLNKKRYEYLKERVFNSEISKKIKLDAAKMYDLRRQKIQSELMSENSKNSRQNNSKTELKSYISPPRTPLKAFDLNEPPSMESL